LKIYCLFKSFPVIYTQYN